MDELLCLGNSCLVLLVDGLKTIITLWVKNGRKGGQDIGGGRLCLVGIGSSAIALGPHLNWLKKGWSASVTSVG